MKTVIFSAASSPSLPPVNSEALPRTDVLHRIRAGAVVYLLPGSAPGKALQTLLRAQRLALPVSPPNRPVMEPGDEQIVVRIQGDQLLAVRWFV